jgi:signal transduction histidine kinase/ActR/RegA family two-component response regulator
MEHISGLQEAKEFINHYNWFERKSINQDTEFKLLKTCEDFAVSNNDTRLLCRTRCFLTSFYTHNNKIQEALDLGLINLKLAKDENFLDELLMMYSFLITIYQLLGDYAHAEEILIPLKELVLDMHDDKTKCSTLIVSANQYFYIKNYEKSFEDFEHALHYAGKINDPFLKANLYNNYGLALMEKDTKLSEVVLLKGAEIIKKENKKTNNYGSLSGYNYCNLAELYVKTGRYSESMIYAKKAIALFKKNNNHIELLEAKLLLADAYLYLRKYKTSVKIISEIINDAVESSANSILLKCYKLLYSLYAKSGKYKLAFEYILKYQELNEMMFNETSNEKIRNLHISHEVKTIRLERENAERIAQLKHDFLANMSHEIRTPINSILGISYLLEQDALTAKQLNYVKRLHNNAEGLLSIINDVLDISKIEAGKIEIVSQKFSILDAVQQVINQLEQRALDKNLALNFENRSSFDDQTVVDGDPHRLKQILINLIGNAIKFTKTGKIDVTLNASDNGCVLSVKDTGIGISPEKAANLFQRYTQADNQIAVQFGGTGLGLAISKKLTELMHGTIELESEPGKGTVFRVSLPYTIVQEYKESKTENEHLEASELTGIKLLIADDNMESRTTTKEVLLHFNADIQISEAENGKIAVDMTRTSSPQMILMDLDMPEMNGFEATIEIRKHFPSSAVKIIATTAGLLSINREELLQYGFDEIILKPYVPEKLVKTLIQVLKQ